MLKKPAYDELDQKIKDLEEELLICKRSIETLRKNERLSKETQSLAKVGGWEFDPETNEIKWTEETYRICELPPENKPELDNIIMFFHPDERETLLHAFQEALDSGIPYDMEVRFITATGKNLWTRMICKPIVLEGKIIRLMGTFHDITDRKKMEQELLESEFRFRELFNHMSSGVAIYDRPDNGENFVFKDLNKAGLEYGQKKKDEIIGWEVREVFP